MSKSKIEWTDETWNPVTGCTKVSSGCKHCYAERLWLRLSAPGQPYAGRKFSDVRCHPERLDMPLHWRKPRRVFVNSMSDLFHEDVPDDFIFSVFVTMAKTPLHTFQCLTKRPLRMMRLIKHWIDWGATWREGVAGKVPNNIWLGVSVENQAIANERIPPLLQTPAVVRFVSIEPMLGAVDLTAIQPHEWFYYDSLQNKNDEICKSPGLDWVIVGGESGPNARPMHPDWAREVRDQCKSAGVPFFFKQMSRSSGKGFKVFETFPQDLQVRQYPGCLNFEVEEE